MNNTITLIHPSRQRPELAFQTLQNWLANAENPQNITYRLSIDEDDPTINQYLDNLKNLQQKLGGIKFRLMIVDINQNVSAISAINTSVKYCESDLVIAVSDDFDCPIHWDTLLLNAVKDKSDFLVRINDGYPQNNWLITLPIMDKVYLKRFGYIYHPNYKHLWCDTEMTCVGRMLDKVIELPELLFKHNHHTLDTRYRDDIASKNDATHEQGKNMFSERFDKDFDLNPEEIVNRIPKTFFIG